MLHLTDISKSFGTQVILENASLHIKPGMRAGLVGANGAGKTTLMRLIAGEMSLDGGEISYRKDLRIGFLPQEIEEIADHAVMDEVLASYADILTAEHRMAQLGDLLARAYSTESPGGHDPEELLTELGALQTAFESAQGYELEARAQTILRGVGFCETDFNRPIAELSGGWRMRVALATGPPDDGRTHQPPGPRKPDLARDVPYGVGRRPHHYQPRSLLPEPRRDSYRRPGPRPN
jgi:ATP-binding cassette subfamily F protein 3